MRWGDWYKHDADTLVHRSTGIMVRIERLWTPATTAEVLLEHAAALSCVDAVHLMIAANALQWDAFNFEGMGDWTDARGNQRGAQVAPAAAVNDA